MTLFDFKKGTHFLYETNRLVCFDPIWVPYRETNRETNREKNTEYFRIIFPNRIFRPSLIYGDKNQFSLI